MPLTDFYHSQHYPKPIEPPEICQQLSGWSPVLSKRGYRLFQKTLLILFHCWWSSTSGSECCFTLCPLSFSAGSRLSSMRNFPELCTSCSSICKEDMQFVKTGTQNRRKTQFTCSQPCHFNITTTTEKHSQISNITSFCFIINQHLPEAVKLFHRKFVVNC